MDEFWGMLFTTFVLVLFVFFLLVDNIKEETTGGVEAETLFTISVEDVEWEIWGLFVALIMGVTEGLDPGFITGIILELGLGV